MSLIKTVKFNNEHEFNIWLYQYDKLPSSQQLYIYGRQAFGYKTYKYVVDVNKERVEIYERKQLTDCFETDKMIERTT